MLKLFRRIRKKLLENGRIRSYLLYALGEILLIVIGILLALQLDTWNSNRQQETQFLSLLEQIYNALDDLFNDRL